MNITSMNVSNPGIEGVPQAGVGITLVNTFELVCGSLGIVGNCLSIFVFKRRSKRNQTNFLITMQAAVDMVASFLLVSLTITTIKDPSLLNASPIGGNIFCVFWKSYVLLWSAFAISTYNLAMISVERWVAVVHPLWYRKLFKRSPATIIAATTWLVAPGINIAYNVIVNHFADGVCVETFNRAQKILSIALFFWEFFIPVSIMTLSFLGIARKLLRMNVVSDLVAANSLTENSHPSQYSGNQEEGNCSSTAGGRPYHSFDDTPSGNTGSPVVITTISAPSMQDGTALRDNGKPSVNGSGGNSSGLSACPFTTAGIRNQRTSAANNSNGGRPNVARRSGASVRRLNITKVLLIVSLCYVVCWSPNQFYFLLLNLGFIKFSDVSYRVTIIMSTCNTCINPFIYALRMKTFRQELKALFKFKC